MGGGNCKLLRTVKLILSQKNAVGCAVLNGKINWSHFVFNMMLLLTVVRFSDRSVAFKSTIPLARSYLFQVLNMLSTSGTCALPMNHARECYSRVPRAHSVLTATSYLFQESAHVWLWACAKSTHKAVSFLAHAQHHTKADTDVHV